MKIIKRIITWAVFVMLLFSLIDAHALSSLEKESDYNAAIVQLETYIESLNHNSTELDGIFSTFNELRGYSMSLHFSYYISALAKIDNEEYDLELDNLLSMLEVNEGFKSYLADMRNDSSIGTIDELVEYAHARESEYKGENESAQEHYRSCITFYDASQHYYALVSSADQMAYDKGLDLMNTGDYAGAYYAFQAIERYSDSSDRMVAIEKQLGYKPVSPTDNLQQVKNLKAIESKPTEIKISWSKARHATAYEVYFKNSTSNDWTYFGNTTEREIIIHNLIEGNTYDFKVVSIVGKIKAEGAILNNQPTNKSTPTHTVTTWGELQHSIETASNGTTYVLDNNIFGGDNEKPITISGEIPITIELNGHTIDRACSKAVDEGSVIVVLEGSSLTIVDRTGKGTITGGNTKNLGGGIIIYGSLVVDGVNIEGNQAYHGGAIYVEKGGVLKVRGASVISKNYATKDGGGIYSHGIISIDECRIENNTCKGGGAGIWSDGDATINNTVICENRDAVNGGGIASHGTMTITKSIIKDNSVSSCGGAIFHGNNSKQGVYALLTMTDVTIQGNKANRRGGGLYIDTGRISFSQNNKIQNNQASNAGGGIYNYDGMIAIEGYLAIDDNTSKSGKDLFSRKKKTIQVMGKLEKNTHIGIVLNNNDTGQITEGYSKYNTIDPSLLFYENSGKTITIQNQEVFIERKP